ncbi:hypothetical protein J4G02_00375 [Candidatus Poribacteria bacterium]|nr:hypothetical protein [Candidatus Poribacteria bacterium]
MKTYSLESAILVRSANILDTLILGRETIQRVLGSMGKKQFLQCFRVEFDSFPLMNKSRKQLELIDSYRLHPISDTGKDYEFLVKKYKDGTEV